MRIFTDVGNEIESRWLEKNYDENTFPDISADVLREANLPAKVSAWDVVEWSLKERELPRQRDLKASFGDPPITVFSGPRFHIDVYFWFEGTTAIHQHGFCGAFQVLLGSSIHSWYEFEPREEINAFTQIGDMSLKVCELLEVGAVQEILAGRQYIHSLFHLDHPSATIVVRTDRSPLHLPQFAYEKPYLAIDPFFEEPNTIKKLQMISTLYRARRDDADENTVALLENSDLQTSYAILSRVRGFLRSNQMDRLFQAGATRDRFAGLLDIVAKKHGTVGEALKPVFERYDVLDEIVDRRAYLTNPEHRFFMALLLNAEGRDQVFDLVKQRYPDVDPLEKVLDWVFDLAETRVLGVEKSNALGIPDFGEVEMYVLENLLHGKTDAEITSQYAAENSDAATATAVNAITTLRSSPVFRALLA